VKKELTPEELTSLIQKISGQTDKLQFDTNNNVKIDIVDATVGISTNITSIEIHHNELFDIDETTAPTVNTNKYGNKTTEFTIHATTATIFTIDHSIDNIHWYNTYTSAAAETDYHNVIIIADQYVRASAAAAGVSGTDTIDIILAAAM